MTVVPRAIGKGELGARVPETDLYPNHIPTPNGTSWISGGVCAMHGSHSVERIDPTRVAHWSAIERAEARARSVAGSWLHHVSAFRHAGDGRLARPHGWDSRMS